MDIVGQAKGPAAFGELGVPWRGWTLAGQGGEEWLGPEALHGAERSQGHSCQAVGRDEAFVSAGKR